jgi:hypothetical protein
VRVRLQDPREHGPAAAAHVDDGVDARIVVRAGRNALALRRKRRHPGVVDLPGFRVLVQKLEQTLAVDVVERGRPRLDRVEKLAVRPPVPRLAEGEHHRAHRIGMIGPEPLGHPRQLEPAVGQLGEDVHAGERAKHPAERVAVGRGLVRELVDRPRPLPEQVGDPELRRDVERLSGPLERHHDDQGDGPRDENRPPAERVHAAGGAGRDGPCEPAHSVHAPTRR